jgi:3-phenylpropionate/cinnamic acid dioxygenase small subunit
MERTLKVVEARHAIEAILFGYAEAIDGGDLEHLVDLLADCRLQMPDGTLLEGGRAVSEHYQRLVKFYDAAEQEVAYRRLACTPRTQHVTTNVQYDFSSDLESVAVRCCFTVHQTLAGNMTLIAGGRYLDRFDSTTHGWRMVERRVLVDHTGDMSRHVHTPLT